jgi:hypothetical protein
LRDHLDAHLGLSQQHVAARLQFLPALVKQDRFIKRDAAALDPRDNGLKLRKCGFERERIDFGRLGHAGGYSPELPFFEAYCAASRHALLQPRLHTDNQGEAGAWRVPASGPGQNTAGCSMNYEYRCVSGPVIVAVKSAKARDQAVKAFEDIMNAEAAKGWEYVGIDEFHISEPEGFLSRKRVYVPSKILVFRREKVAPITADPPAKPTESRVEPKFDMAKMSDDKKPEPAKT